jgi:hypothetical protein
MNRKLACWMGGLLAVCTGCATLDWSGDSSGNGWPSHSSVSTGGDSHAKALTAWEVVRSRHGRTFTDEFREGFFAGFTAYVEKGAASEPPPVPPAPYDRYKKYLAPEGRVLVRDYYLGYQYGLDVAQAAASPPRVPLVPTRTPPARLNSSEQVGGKLAEAAPSPWEPLETADETPGELDKNAPVGPARPVQPPQGSRHQPVDPIPRGDKFTRPSPSDRLPAPEAPLPTQSPLVPGPLPVPPVANPPVPPRGEPIPLPPPPTSSGKAASPESSLPLILTEFPVFPFAADPPGK